MDLTENPIEGESILIDKITNSQQINSGIELKKTDWVFIPYNFQYQSRRNELEKLIKENGLDIHQMTYDVCYVTFNIRKIKNIYKKVSGNINQNSMCLYSGPEDDNAKYHKHINLKFCDCHYYCRPLHYNNNQVGCIYTGDADLNITKIDQIYKKYWHNVGTIQIPHHGDLKSFCKTILKNNLFICPISFGDYNSYGHPSNQLVLDIYKQHSIPIFITERLSSIFIENIE